MKREISYSDVQSSLKTGDLVLFHGVQTTSKLIELIEWSYWSHVGMVVIPSDIGLPGDEPLFWESTASGDGIVDVINNAPKESGPMLVPLSQRINVDLTKHFDTHFKVKYLSRALSDNELVKLKETIHKLHNWKFPTAAEAFKYYIEGREKNIQSPEGIIFCSQMTAKTLMNMGFISNKYVDNGYCPNDFDKFEAIPSLLPFYFIEGARLK